MNKILMEDAVTIAEAGINWGRFNHKTVLIAGANGYVPQHFVHGFLMRNRLFHADIHVIALCRSKSKAKEVFKEYLDRKEFTLLFGDVRKNIDIQEKIDFIIDAASPAGVKNSNEDPIATFEANVFGCRNLLELARKHQAEMLFLSSVDIYGIAENKRFREDDTGILNPLDVRNVYAAAKRAAENLCSCYSKEGIICKIVRPSQIMGCGIALDDGRLHIDFISQLLNGNIIILKGDGTPVRSFIYMTDAVIGMLIVMTEGCSGEAYNICTESGEISVLGMAELMAGQVKNRTVQIVLNERTGNKDPEVIHAISKVCASSQKLCGLGWKPRVSLTEACRRMMQYYSVQIQ